MSIRYKRSAIAIGLFTLVSDAAGAPAPGHAAFRPASSSERVALVRELERLTEGLLFISESDAPLTVITWPHAVGRPTARHLAALLGLPHPELVEQTTVDRFFGAAMRSWPGQTAEDAFIVRRYTALLAFLKNRLRDPQVFRFGRTTIRSYVIGVAPNGDWVGLATNQTET